MLIQNGIVHTMDGPIIPCGFVLTEGSKITAVGPMSDLPRTGDAAVLDARGGHILPGFVDAHCHLGMFGNALGFEADDGNESTDPCTPHLRAIDAINPLDRCFAEARAGGVTSVLTGPGSANPIAGQFVALKTTGRWVDRMILKAPVAMKFALGENPKNVYNERKETPVTRMATAAIIRENLSKTLEYMDRQHKADIDPDVDAPDFDAKLEALIPVLRGELPVHCHAHRADDIATAVRIAKEFGLKLVVVHGTEGHLIADLLAQEHIPVITGPCLTDRCKPELAGQTLENPVLLAKAGVQVAICTDHPETPIQHLPLCAA
ncbi:MAG: amidohydrolase, partial [Pseudoflavonifractor sp.]